MNWLVTDCRTWLPNPWASIAMTLAAVFCGSIVGSEREKRDKPAGLRTLILVCLGSTVFTVASFAFGTSTGDTGRVAAQIVTGVGFLGAGVILHGRTAVTGMTTAATIWVTAAMGVVVGTGYLVAGFSLALVIRAVLSGIAYWEYKLSGQNGAEHFELIADADHGKTRIRLERLLHDFQVPKECVQTAQDGDETLRINLHIQLPHRPRLDLLTALVELPGVREIREVPASLAQPQIKSP